MPIEVLDPTYGDDGNRFRSAPRLDTLQGAIIGVISNGKRGTRPFFDGLAEALVTRHGAADVDVMTKPNYSAPADDELILGRAARWNALVSGIGD